MTKCVECGENFEITEDGREFYAKMGVQEPRLCPVDRSRRRLAFRHGRKLYKRKCDLTGEPIVSQFDANVSFPVYRASEWHSDKWEAMDYRVDFDFDKGFFEQYQQLYNQVPQMGRAELNNENSDFSNGIAHCEDSYLCFLMDYSENCFYVTNSKYCQSCVDCLGIVKCELCYQCIRCDSCYNAQYSIRSTNCRDSMWLADCRGCRNCIGCCNLVNKEYHIFNQKVTPEEFEVKRKELDDYDGRQKFAQEFAEFSLKYPKKYYYGHSNEDSDGDDIRHLKNSHYCFDSDDLENCSYCNYVFKARGCYDVDVFGDNSERVYNCTAVGINCMNIVGCMYTWNSRDVYYSTLMTACQDCFGCSGLKNKQYCIGNKQYSKDEYETLRDKLIAKMKDEGIWGEFFPVTLSHFAYNESWAQEYYPLDKEEIKRRGWRWKGLEDSVPEVENFVEANVLPNNPEGINLDVLKLAIKCRQSSRPYVLQEVEVKFYIQQRIPLPRLHPEVRHQERLKLRNPYLLFDRRCDCVEGKHGHVGRCGMEFKTSYAPDPPSQEASARQRKVYCEECYLNIVN